jgi:type IX secretion system PorP/SprF family membrane protein
MRHKLLLFIFTGTWAVAANAQSDFDFTQRWFNESLYNPAAVGNSFSTGYFFHTRSQWLGLEKAPVTIAGSFDTYNQSLRSGIGASLTADYIGVYQNYNFRAAYSYYLQLGSRGMISFGLSAGVFVREVAFNSSQLDNPSDPILAYTQEKEYAPDFDFGVEYKGAFKFGVTVRHLGAQSIAQNRYSQPLNVWSYISSRFNISGAVSVEPLLSFTWRQSIYRVEGGALLYFFKTKNLHTYNDRFWIGGVYRTNHNIAVMAGMNVTSQLRIGYSFDYGLSNVATIATFGTHEIFVAYQFNRKFYKDVCCPAFR